MMPRMGDVGPVMVEVRAEDTGDLIQSRTMGQVPAVAEEVELINGSVYKVESVRYVFSDATEGKANRVACKAVVKVSVVP